MIKVIKRSIDVIFIILIVLLAIYGILKLTNKVGIYKVQTGSMEDGIHVGDYILIYKTKNIKKNDIVTFEKDEGFITHRVVKINGDKLITKGDANNTEDEEINIDKVIGKTILVGGVLNFVINFKFALISLMLTIYLFTTYIDSKDKKRKEENEE